MLSRTIRILNGDYWMNYRFYKCDGCSTEMEEAWPIFRHHNSDYCPSCAFLKGFISSETFVNNVGGLSSDMFKAAINPETGKIEVAFIKRKFSWELTNRDYRRTKQYATWRTSVFERDRYTCQECGQVGGELEGHHIKPFAKYVKLRYEIKNGVTLCKMCHKERHRRLKLAGAKYG